MLDLFGNLWVADANNDRVVKYAAPLGSGAAAAMVIGQGDDGNFTTAGCDRGIAPGDLFGLGADSLCAPAAVAVDANVDLYVADTGNNRSTIYDGIVATPTATAHCERNRHRHGVCHCDRHGERDSDRVCHRDRVVFGYCHRHRYAVRHSYCDAGAARRQDEAECEDDQVRQGRGRQPFGRAHAANRKRGHHDAGRNRADDERAVSGERRRIHGQPARLDGGDDHFRADEERIGPCSAGNHQQRPEASGG